MNFFHKGEETFGELSPRIAAILDPTKYNFIYVAEDGGVFVETSSEINMRQAEHAYLVLKAIPEDDDTSPHVEVLKSRGVMLCGPEYYDSLSAPE